MRTNEGQRSQPRRDISESGLALMTRKRRTHEEIQADRMADRYEASLERRSSDV